MGTVSTNSTYTFTVTGNRSLTAVFEAVIPTYTITAAIDPPEAGTVTGAGQYQEGETVTLTASINDGYSFTGWQENGETVSTDNPYTFTAAGDRVFTAVFEAVKPSKLPEGYTEVEYIQSNGSQYILTDLRPTSNMKITMDIETLQAVTSSSKEFFDSSYVPSSSTKYTFRISINKAGVRASMGSGNTVSYTTLSSNTTPRRMLLSLDAENKKASIDGVEKAMSSNSFSSAMNNIYLLTYNGETASAIPAKLFSCKIEKSGVLARDFVPCTNPSGIAGLYDLVNGKFYRSSGPGVFTAGPAV